MHRDRGSKGVVTNGGRNPKSMNKHRRFSKTAIAMLLIVLLGGMVTTVACTYRGLKL